MATSKEIIHSILDSITAPGPLERVSSDLNKLVLKVPSSLNPGTYATFELIRTNVEFNVVINVRSTVFNNGEEVRNWVVHNDVDSVDKNIIDNLYADEMAATVNEMNRPTDGLTELKRFYQSKQA